jgi:hypothetical protein
MTVFSAVANILMLSGPLYMLQILIAFFQPERTEAGDAARLSPRSTGLPRHP